MNPGSSFFDRAKAAGYSDEAIRSYLGARTTTQEVTQPKKRNLLTSLLPAGLAIGAGAIAAPFTGGLSLAGTIAALGAASAVGGAAGELGAQRLNKERTNWGSIAKEGGISGAFGAGGAAFGAAKGLRAAKAAGIVGDDATRLAGEVARGAMRAKDIARGVEGANVLTKAGQRATQYGSGLKIGKEVGGIDKADDLAKFMARYTGTPRQQLRKMSVDMKGLGSQVDDILTKTPVRLNGTQVGNTLKRGFKDPTDALFADLDLTNTGARRALSSYSAKFARLKDAKAINDQLKTIQGLASKANAKLILPGSAPLTAQETAALATKRAADEVLSKITSIKPLKQQMARIFEANPMVTRASEQVFKLPMVGGNIPGVAQGARGVMSKVGGKLTGAGVASGRSVVFPQAVRQGLPRAIMNSFAPTPPDTMMESGMGVGGFGGGVAGAGMNSFGGEQEVQSPYPKEAVMMDIQRDPKNMDKYMKMYEFMNKGNEMTADQRKRQVKSQGLLQSVGILIDNFQKAGAGQGAGGVASSILGRTPGIRSLGLAPEAQQFEDQRKALIAPLARAISGEVGVLTDRDIKRAEGLLPRLSDPAQVANKKIQDLLYLIQANSGGQSELSDVLQSFITQGQ